MTQDIQRIIHIYGFLGDFTRYKPVGYVVEDLDNGQRRVCGYNGCEKGEEKQPFISMISELSLAMYYLRIFKPTELKLTMFVPITLLTIQDVMNELDKVKEVIDNEEKESYLSVGEVLVAVLKRLAVRLKELNNLYRANDCCPEAVMYSINFHNRLRQLLERLASEASADVAVSGEGRIEHSKFRTNFIAVPLTLTQTIRNHDGDRLLTFRLARASDFLAYITALIEVNDSYEKLSSMKRGELHISIDLTHGVNYAPGSVMTGVYEYLQPWLGAWFTSHINPEDDPNSVSVKLSIYNSDPVIGQPLQPKEGSYKMHLIRHWRPAKLSFTAQEFLNKLTVSASREGLIKVAMEHFPDLTGATINIDKEHADAIVLALASAAVGMPFEAVMYAKLIGKVLEEIARPLRYIPHLLPKKVRFRARKAVVSADYEDKVKADRLENILRLYSAAIVLKEILVAAGKCLEVDIYEGPRGARILGLNRIKVKNAQEGYEKCFRWLSRTSKYIVINELENDKIKLEGTCKAFGYEVGGLNKRNLIAHAGLARGAALYIKYCRRSESESYLNEVILVDTEELRNTLNVLAGISK